MQRVWVQSPVGELRSHMPCGQKNQNIKQKQYCNEFNTDFKNGPHQKKLKKEKRPARKQYKNNSEIGCVTQNYRRLKKSSLYGHHDKSHKSAKLGISMSVIGNLGGCSCTRT